VGVAAASVLAADRRIEVTAEGVGVAAVAGVFAGVGAVAFYPDLAPGRTGIITTISALYFVVAALVGVGVFGESLGLRKVVGIGFAVLAVALLAS
jgi:uncharacterized membrane protein